jgi:hypothetical protein
MDDYIGAVIASVVLVLMIFVIILASGVTKVKTRATALETRATALENDRISVITSITGTTANFGTVTPAMLIGGIFYSGSSAASITLTLPTTETVITGLTDAEGATGTVLGNTFKFRVINGTSASSTITVTQPSGPAYIVRGFSVTPLAVSAYTAATFTGVITSEDGDITLYRS